MKSLITSILLIFSMPCLAQINQPFSTVHAFVDYNLPIENYADGDTILPKNQGRLSLSISAENFTLFDHIIVAVGPEKENSDYLYKAYDGPFNHYFGTLFSTEVIKFYPPLTGFWITVFTVNSQGMSSEKSFIYIE